MEHMTLLIGIAIITSLGLLLGLGLGVASQKLQVEGDPLVDELKAMLPGAQCGQCGFAGCGPAAEALARGEVAVTLCPPGGRTLAAQLAGRLGVKIDLSAVKDKGPQLAAIAEEACIGCTKCFKVCPTDAIIGAPKQIHSVLTQACTGCGACVDVCPTDALAMQGVLVSMRTWYWPKPHSEAA